MKFDVILWDMDGTLLDFKIAQKEAITQVFRTIHKPLTDDIIDLYSRINESYWKRLELGEVTRPELLVGRFRRLFEELGMNDVDVDSVRKEYEEVLGNVYEYIQDSLGLCKMLQPKCKQYIVTNGIAGTQNRKIKLSGFRDCMNDCFISEDAGYEKPNPKFFEYTFSKIPNFDPERTLIVGDSLTSDIKGGALAGIKTCWFNPERKEITGDYKPDYEIEHLWDVLRILDFML